MAIKFQGINIQGPYSKVVGWNYPLGDGFMFRPTDQENPEGWGKPFEGTTYGTPAGKHEVKHLFWGKKEETWKWVKEPGDQVYGHIDWIGPYRKDKKGTRDGTDETNRERISYSGPPARYFASEPDDFFYGSDPSHEEVYYQGRYLAIAPKPVLGACLQITEVDQLDDRGAPIPDPDGPGNLKEDEIWIIAMCKDNDSDILYRKPWPASTIRKDGMNPETRASFKATKSEAAPAGWETIRKFDKQNKAYAADTPWFFNESGDEAKATRRFDDEFDNGAETVNEDAFYLYSLSMSGSGNATITNDGVWGDRFEFKVESVKRHEPVYTDGGKVDPLDGLTYTHEWQEDDLETTITLNGQVTACFDYVGDVLITGTLYVYGHRSHAQYWTDGVDDPGYINSLGNNISNISNNEGPTYDNPDPYIPDPEDHNPHKWLGDKHYYALGWDHPDDGYMQFTFGVQVSGTQTDWDTGWDKEATDPEDTGLYVSGGFNRWVHFLDMRHKVAAYYEVEMNFFWRDDQEDFYKKESLMMRSVDGEPDTHEDNLKNFTSDKQSKYKLSGAGYFRDRMEAWDKSEELLEEYSRTSWTGEWSPDNEDSSIIEPSEREFYMRDTPDIERCIDYWTDYDDWGYRRWLKWPDYFKKHNFVPGGYAVDNSTPPNMFMSLVVEDLTSGGQKKVNLFVADSNLEDSEGKVEEMIPFGDQYFPIGVY